MKGVHGYKVFHSDWTCGKFSYRKQYYCPGKFEEDVDLAICKSGMHFCENLGDCFKYYAFNPENKVAEVIAYGKIETDGVKSVTDKLEIVREIPWYEVLRLVNIGKDCTGLCNTGNRNTGNRNTGNWNTGNRNTGNWNTGDRNTGNCNTGNWNTGDRNTGNCNTGDWNTGGRNTGNRNTGNWNTGDRNTGNCNTGDCNTGFFNTGNNNTGDRNTGDMNTGFFNTGNGNTGNCNTGDWNKSSFNTGCFMTEEHNIMMFNKPSEWTFEMWLNSKAHFILSHIPRRVVEWIYSDDMTDEEKTVHPEHDTTGGYLKVLDESECGQIWWNGLSDEDKEIIRSIPNFDPDIFYQCTGIKVDE